MYKSNQNIEYLSRDIFLKAIFSLIEKYKMDGDFIKHLLEGHNGCTSIFITEDEFKRLPVT